MSKDNKLALQEGEPTTDLTEQDMGKIALFKEEGMPGLAVMMADDGMYVKMMNLYLDGKSYRQVSQIVRIDKTLIMFLSDKFGWYMMRREYLHELEMRQRQDLIESKIEDKDMLLQFMHMWRKRFGSSINKYLQTGDERWANEIDLKAFDRYLKTVDMLHKLSHDGKIDKPAVGLNLGDGVTITRKGDNEVEITPKQRTIKDALKQFADMRREEEQKSRQKPTDMADMIEENKGESNEET
jgi:hypothetical protein